MVTALLVSLITVLVVYSTQFLSYGHGSTQMPQLLDLGISPRWPGQLYGRFLVKAI